MDLIVDAHLDMAYNALTWKRDYHRSAHWTREQESEDSAAAKHNGLCTVGLPELTRGRIGVVFGTIFCQPSTHRMSAHEITYNDAREAHAQGMAQLDFYRRWADDDPEHIRLIGTQRDLDAVVSQWTADNGHPTAAPKPGSAVLKRDPGPRQIGIVPLMEGADPILEPKELERWVERGLRIVGPAWDTTRYAGGTWAGGGLSHLGHELLDMMAEFNVILDVSHLSQQALMEALDAFRGEHVIATHSNPRRFIQTDRHLPDEAIERIAERKGVMGVVLFN